MKTTSSTIHGVKEALALKEEELVQTLRTRDGIVIEKSADQMDEIQDASERDLAICNVDRESITLRQVRAARQRIRDGHYGICIDCEWEIDPKRLAAVPWAARCLACQESADRHAEPGVEVISEPVSDVT